MRAAASSARDLGILLHPIFTLGLILLGPASIGSQAQEQYGPIAEYAIPVAGGHPQGIALGPDLVSIWFTDPGTSSIGVLRQSGQLTIINEFPTPTPASMPTGIVAVPAGDIWFTETNANQIGRVTVNGTFIEYPIPTPASAPTGIAYDGNGTLWFTERDGNKIGSITIAGVITEYPIPTASSHPNSILFNYPFGGVWFIEQSGNNIGTVVPTGVVEYPIPTPQSNPAGIAAASVSTLIFTEGAVNQIGILTQTAFTQVDPPLPTTIQEIPLPTANSGPSGIATNAGNCFVESIANLISCITIEGDVGANALFQEFAIPTPASNPQGIVRDSSAGYWFTELATGRIGHLPSIGFSVNPLAIVNRDLAPAAVGMPYSYTLVATGGTPPYTWSALPISFPAGLSLSAAGVISGTPTALASQSLDITVTDASGTMIAHYFTLPVNTTGCTYSLTSSGETFPAVGGSGSFVVNAPIGCQWSLSGAPSWVSISRPTTILDYTVQFVVNPNNTTLPLTATLIAGGQSFTVQQEAGPAPFVGNPNPANFMPHLVTQGGWSTAFTLVNNGFTSANTETVFYDDNGNLLSLPLTFPQQTGSASEAWVNQNVAPNQSLIFQASGMANGSFLEGSAQIWTSSPSMEGFAIFHFNPSGQEAVVPFGGSGYVIPFDTTNGLTTGLALENTSASPIYAPVFYYDDTGKLIYNESVSLTAYGHMSRVISLPFAAKTRGVAVVGNCYPQPGFCSPVKTLGIRYTPPGTLTTVAPLNTAVDRPALIPHIASGSGWQTTFVISNVPNSVLAMNATSTQAQLAFFDESGNPLPLSLTNPDTGVTTTASSISQSIPAYGTVWLTTAGDVGTPLLTGSAQLTGASGFAIFRYSPNGQEAVSPMQIQPQNSVIAFDNTNGIGTGIAVANASAQAVSIPVTIRDDQGIQIGTSSLSLAADGHTSFMLASQYPVAANIRGTVEFDAVNVGGQTAPNISVLGIRSPPDLTFTTLPALPK